MTRRPAKRAGRYASNAYSLVDVLFQAAVEHVFEKAGKAVVVLRRYDDEAVRLVHLVRKRSILDRLSGVVDRQRQGGDIDDLADDVPSAVRAGHRESEPRARSFGLCGSYLG